MNCQWKYTQLQVLAFPKMLGIAVQPCLRLTITSEGICYITKQLSKYNKGGGNPGIQDRITPIWKLINCLRL